MPARARPPAWTAIPLVLAALGLLCCSALLGWNIVRRAVRPDAPPMFAAAPAPAWLGPLLGATLPTTLPDGTGAVLDGRFQAAIGPVVGAEMPLYPAMVRLRNQLSFSLFDQSEVPDVVVARHRTLLEGAYVQDWCTRNLAAFRAGAPAWAARIRAMQDAVERRGHVFLYVLTPSKVALYPSLLPAAIACPSSDADRAAIVPFWLGALRNAGVHVADARDAVADARARYPAFRMFPDGGTHWNWVAVALAGQAVAEAADRLRPGLLAPFSFDWRMGPPDGVDVDLASLLNLGFHRYGVPAPSVALHPRGACAARAIAFVGGSFGGRLGELIARDCPRARFDMYEYWHSNHIAWEPGGAVRFAPVRADERDPRLLGADLLLYEENEQLLGHSEHGAALDAFLRAHP